MTKTIKCAVNGCRGVSGGADGWKGDCGHDQWACNCGARMVLVNGSRECPLCDRIPSAPKPAALFEAGERPAFVDPLAPKRVAKTGDSAEIHFPIDRWATGAVTSVHPDGRGFLVAVEGYYSQFRCYWHEEGRLWRWPVACQFDGCVAHEVNDDGEVTTRIEPETMAKTVER